MTLPFGDPGLSPTGFLVGTGVRVAALNASNNNAQDRFLLIFDSASAYGGVSAAPVVGAPPRFAIRVPAQSQTLYNLSFFGEGGPDGQGMRFDKGFAWAWSTVSTSYDGLATASDHTVFGAYAG